jgi:hypothetical protein
MNVFHRCNFRNKPLVKGDYTISPALFREQLEDIPKGPEALLLPPRVEDYEKVWLHTYYSNEDGLTVCMIQIHELLTYVVLGVLLHTDA